MHSKSSGRGTYTNDTACSTSTSIASLQALFIATLTEIILASVNNDHSSKNALGSNQFEVRILECSRCSTRRVSLDVAQIASMAVGGSRSTVTLVVGIEMGACELTLG